MFVGLGFFEVNGAIDSTCIQATYVVSVPWIFLSYSPCFPSHTKILRLYNKDDILFSIFRIFSVCKLGSSLKNTKLIVMGFTLTI